MTSQVHAKSQLQRASYSTILTVILLHRFDRCCYFRYRDALCASVVYDIYVRPSVRHVHCVYSDKLTIDLQVTAGSHLWTVQ